MDCVGHDGGIVSEQCCFTLSVTDVYSGWIERKAMLNRASKWVIEAMTQIRQECPVPIVEIHPDNGSEFINHQMVNYCKDNNLRIPDPGQARKMITAMWSRKTLMPFVSWLAMHVIRLLKHYGL